jgi:hypothetical protein
LFVCENVSDRTNIAPTADSFRAIDVALRCAVTLEYVTASNVDEAAVVGLVRERNAMRVASLRSRAPVRATDVPESLVGHTNASGFAVALGVGVGVADVDGTVLPPPPPPHPASKLAVASEAMRARTYRGTGDLRV